MRIYLITFLSIIGLTSFGQVKFTASVEKTFVGINERFVIEFALNDRGRDFTPPSFEGFRIVGGPSRGESTVMRNRDIQFTQTVSFMIQATKTGKLNIGPATVNVDGQVYESNSLVMTVSEEAPGSKDPNDPTSIAAREAFLKVKLNKSSIYQGEPVVAEYILYFKSNNQNLPRIIKDADFSGFYKKRIDIKAYKTETEYVNGIKYSKSTVFKQLLIPQKARSLKGEKVEVSIPTYVSTNQKDFFGRRMKQMVEQQVSIPFPNLKVKALPSNNKPSYFGGAVGKYKLEVSVDNKEITPDQSISLKIKLSGNGNISLADLPEPQFPSAFEVYEPKFRESISSDVSGMKGYKQLEYLLVPRFGGEYKIPPIKYAYFDPKKGKYIDLETEEIIIQIAGDPAPGGQRKETGGAVLKESVEYINEDILFVKREIGEPYKGEGKAFIDSIFYYLLLALLILLPFLIFLLSRRQKELLKDKKGQKKKRASKLALKHLKRAKELQSSNKDEFYEALSQALWGYFSDKLSINQSALSKEKIAESLEEHKVSQESINSLMDLLARAEMARYSSHSKTSQEKDFEDSSTLIMKIESEL